MIVMVVDGHDWREKVTYHGPERRYAIERDSTRRVCMDCGVEKLAGETVEDCAVLWSARTGFRAESR
jgi:hypothetical protein